MRGYKGSIPKKQYIDMPERILSSLSYLTSGMVGFVWLIITHLQGKSLSSFARFHIFQSIFLSIILYVAEYNCISGADNSVFWHSGYEYYLLSGSISAAFTRRAINNRFSFNDFLFLPCILRLYRQIWKNSMDFRYGQTNGVKY